MNTSHHVPLALRNAHGPVMNSLLISSATTVAFSPRHVTPFRITSTLPAMNAEIVPNGPVPTPVPVSQIATYRRSSPTKTRHTRSASTSRLGPSASGIAFSNFGQCQCCDRSVHVVGLRGAGGGRGAVLVAMVVLLPRAPEQGRTRSKARRPRSPSP